MLVKVRLLGSLKPPNVRGEFEVDLPTESKIATLIEELPRLYPEIANSLRNPSTSNLIMLDGVEIGNLDGLDTPLAKYSKIVLVPVTHGGR
jgi:molybdopterin converting factor small subunit